MAFRLATIAVFMLASALSAQLVGIAQIPDPPPSIDGSLGRIVTSPTTRSWGTRESVVFGPGKWTGGSDLSGELFLGWDANHLYVGAIVIDDTVVQPYFGRDIYKGDHLEVFLDVPRKDVASRSGESVYQIGLSPGNFAAGEANIPPELIQWSPSLGVVRGGKLVRQENG